MATAKKTAKVENHFGEAQELALELTEVPIGFYNVDGCEMVKFDNPCDAATLAEIRDFIAEHPDCVFAQSYEAEDGIILSKMPKKLTKNVPDSDSRCMGTAVIELEGAHQLLMVTTH